LHHHLDSDKHTKQGRSQKYQPMKGDYCSKKTDLNKVSSSFDVLIYLNKVRCTSSFKFYIFLGNYKDWKTSFIDSSGLKYRQIYN